MMEPSSPPQYDVILKKSGWNESEYRETYLIEKSFVTNAWIISTDAMTISAVTMWNAPMPLSMSRRDARRAPATDAAAA
jgi:hypothetical protein